MQGYATEPQVTIMSVLFRGAKALLPYASSLRPFTNKKTPSIRRAFRQARGMGGVKSRMSFVWCRPVIAVAFSFAKSPNLGSEACGILPRTPCPENNNNRKESPVNQVLGFFLSGFRLPRRRGGGRNGATGDAPRAPEAETTGRASRRLAAVDDRTVVPG